MEKLFTRYLAYSLFSFVKVIVILVALNCCCFCLKIAELTEIFFTCDLQVSCTFMLRLIGCSRNLE